MTACAITEASYDRLGDALDDWAAMLAADSDGKIRLVDAVLLDTDDGIVVALHRWLDHRRAGGAVASAIIALVQPASIMLGAMAGGIGEQMLVASSRSTTRRDVLRLGEVMDLTRYSIVSILQSGPGSPIHLLPWRRARAFVVVPSQLTDDDVAWAMLADRAAE